MWSKQIHALLEDHEFYHFLENDEIRVKSGFHILEKIRSPPLQCCNWHNFHAHQPIIASDTATHEVWSILASVFGTPTRGHIRQIWFQIKICVKGTKTISEYLRMMKIKADDLALLEKPMDPKDLIEQVLVGLPEEYKPEVDAVNSRDNLISFSELHEKLINQSHDPLLPANNTGFPHICQSSNLIKEQNNWRPPSAGQQQQQSQHQHNRNFSRSPHPYLAKCQACGTQGHSAQQCPIYHIVPAKMSYPNNSPCHPSANAARLTTTNNDGWLMDSGTSHRVTSDLKNLSLHNFYTGNDSILVGSGSNLSISHAGSFSYLSPTHNFNLRNVLYLPTIQQNLLSIHQFRNDNKTCVEFFPNMFQVKDLYTGTSLLTGPAKDGSYEWPCSSRL